MLNYDTQDSRIFILGDGGFANELLAYFKAHTKFNPQLVPKGKVAEYQKAAENSWSILGSGHPHIKRRMVTEAVGQFACFVHPKAVVHALRIEPGSVIAPGVILAPNTTIGKHVLVNYNATVGHDSVVGDFSVVSPTAAIGGNCKIGKGVYVGAGALVRENLTIADNVVIGMGAVVVKDILDPGITVVGIPARKMEKP